VLAQNVVRAALFLILTLAMVAGVFLLLSAEFLALVQVLIYGGAVTILMLFALMLTRAQDLPRAGFGAQWPFAVVSAGALLVVIVMMVFESDWNAPDEPTVIGFRQLGDTLFRVWSVPFEVASLVLLVALIGAIVLSSTEDAPE
jgi:NADH-quinone oxidoreductase subunit J